jgi:hypothetical protein
LWFWHVERSFVKRMAPIDQIFKKIKIARFLQQVLASSQNIRDYLFFKILSIAKFHQIFLWMISSLATSQTWKIKNLRYNTIYTKIPPKNHVQISCEHSYKCWPIIEFFKQTKWVGSFYKYFLDRTGYLYIIFWKFKPIEV